MFSRHASRLSEGQGQGLIDDDIIARRIGDTVASLNSVPGVPKGVPQDEQ